MKNEMVEHVKFERNPARLICSDRRNQKLFFYNLRAVHKLLPLVIQIVEVNFSKLQSEQSAFGVAMENLLH